MILWMITDVFLWMSIRENTEKWRLDTVTRTVMRLTTLHVRSVVRYSVMFASLECGVVEEVSKITKPSASSADQEIKLILTMRRGEALLCWDHL